MFAAHNHAQHPVFNVVRRGLTALCSGAARCVYCEDSARDQVEHYKPKDLYPEEVFRWENYVYACGPCNRLKGAKFAIFRSSDGRFSDVTRKAGEQVIPPVHGDPVLLHCRIEDPMHFLHLDLLGTFLFLPRPGLSARETRRADYTIDLLRLNMREELPVSREQAYQNFRARVEEFKHKRDDGVLKSHLDRLRSNLERANHPTVWREMVRQRNQIGELVTLFQNVPELI